MIKGRLVRLLSHAKKYIVYNVLCQWISLLAQVVIVYSVAGLLEQLLITGMAAEQMKNIVGILIVAVVVRFVCDRLSAKASYYASVDVKRILREKIYDKLLRLGAAYREKTATSEIVQICAEGVEQLETYFGKYISQLFYSLLAPITLFVILSPVNMKASIVLLVCVPLIPVSIVAVQKIAKKLLNKYWGLYTSLGDSFLENLQGLTTLKIYQADGDTAVKMDEEAQMFRKVTMKVLTMQLNSTSVMDIIAYGGAAVGMIVAVSEYFKGNVDFAGTIMIVLLASEFFIPLRLLGSFFHIAMNGMAASDKIFALLDLEEPEEGTEVLPESGLDIQLKDVHFSYEEDREILKGIDIDIPAGSFVSLVGESGCGKSTIAGLLAAKNRGYSGEVTIGNIPLRDVSESNLMKHIVMVRHNSYLFKGTVAENLRMAKPDASKEEMEAVLEQVNLLAFLNTQQGLETKLLEKGSNFSGGQCQRLALARALLASPDIFIFDEASSNVDVESEELIMKVIHGLAGKKTVILISHRLYNVMKSDCIYMIADGEIKEKGSHDELMALNGKYAHLYQTQQSLEQYAKGDWTLNSHNIEKAVEA